MITTRDDDDQRAADFLDELRALETRGFLDVEIDEQYVPRFRPTVYGLKRLVDAHVDEEEGVADAPG